MTVVDRRTLSGAPVLLSGGMSTETTFPAVTLRLGMCGTAVVLWQQWISALASVLGTPRVEDDGVFGSDTRTATMAVQRALKIGVDGAVGSQTKRAAFVHLSAAAPGRRVADPTATVTACSSSRTPTTTGSNPTTQVPPQDERSLLELVADNPVISIAVGAGLVVLIRGNRKK